MEIPLQLFIHLPFDMYHNVGHTVKCSSSSDKLAIKSPQRPRNTPKKNKSHSQASTSLHGTMVPVDIRRSPRKHNITRTPGTPTG